MTSHPRMWLALVVAVVFAGCHSPDPRPPFGEVPPVLLLVPAGAHFLWVDEDTIEAEAYIVNVAGTALDFHDLSVSSLLRGEGGGDLTLDEVPPSGRNWSAGEVRVFRSRFDEARPIPQRLFVSVRDNFSVVYETGCHAPNGEEVLTCGRAWPNPEFTPEKERGLWPTLEACCDWLPPSLDVHGSACGLGAARVECAFNVLNWRDPSVTAAGKLTLYATPPTPGATREILATSAFDVGTLGKLETRAITAGVDLLPGTVLTPGHTHEVEIQTWHVDRPSSMADDTTLVVFAETP